MKIIALILVFSFATIAYSQGPDNKSLIADMDNFYNKGKIDKLEVITSEILSGKYGVTDDELKFYALMYSSNVYTRDDYAKKDSQKGYDKLSELLLFANTTSYAIPNKESFIKTMTDYLVEYKNKHPELKTTNLENKSNVVVDNTATTTANIAKNTSEDKTVTLTVSGTGKTLEEAKLNALRSAIEQAFGAFISSKTEILNDNLIKDEIVSVASGNIMKYDVISQIEIPANGFAINLSATVSIEKLTSFAESKGVVVEFKGGMFGLKIKLQKLNEESEFIAIKNLLLQSFEMLEKSIDYSLNVKDPKLAEKTYQSDVNDIYIVDLEVVETKNKNYDNFQDYLVRTLSKIALNDNEANEITKNGKDLCYLLIDGQYLRFRNEKSINALFNFSMICSMIAANTFCIKNNLGIVKIPNKRAVIFRSFINYNVVSVNDKKDFNVLISTRPEQVDVNEIPLMVYIKKNGFNINQLLELKIRADENDWISRKDKFLKLDTNFDYSNKYTKYDGTNLNYKLKLKLSDIEKIESFQIEKISFEDLLMKRELYREIEERQTSSCFLKGTKIATPKGSKNIEDIKVGDEVICFDDKSELHISVVESVNSHQNQDVFKYNIWNGEPLFATPNHWVLTSENSFSEIGKLNEMLTLVDINGGLKPITKVEYYSKETVYNFIVKEYHTYIANDIRVHNGGKGKYLKNISKN